VTPRKCTTGSRVARAVLETGSETASPITISDEALMYVRRGRGAIGFKPRKLPRLAIAQFKRSLPGWIRRARILLRECRLMSVAPRD